MGFISRDNAVEAYKRIKQAAIGHVCSILILAAPSLDAICALKILTVRVSGGSFIANGTFLFKSLFKSDFLPFKVVPVAGYDDIVAANDNFLQGRNEVSTIKVLTLTFLFDRLQRLSCWIAVGWWIWASSSPWPRT